MKRSIIITDLTRFAPGNPKVCTAGIDRVTGECVRPIPYITSKECNRLEILPGGILEGDFKPSPNRTPPHVEDCSHKDLRFLGACPSEEFENVLERSSFPSLTEGFGVDLKRNEKAIPKDHKGERSIITLKASPDSVEIIEDDYKPGRIKLNFVDESGREFRFIPITDLGFFDYAQQHRERGELDALNQWIAEQKRVYLRVGLSRFWNNGNGKEGFWLQANGIYTFPEAVEGIRGYAH